MINIKVYVKGMVQGVGFRYFTLINAEKIGIKGYVKNLYDGSVYCEAEGTPEQVQEFYSILKKGPSRSYIQNVDFEYSDFTGKFSNFEIR